MAVIPPDSFFEYLDNLLLEKGWTDYRLTKEAKLSGTSFMSQLRKGKKLGYDACAKIADALGVQRSEMYVRAGLDKARLPKPDPRVTQMVSWFTSLSAETQKKAEELMQQLAEGKQMATPEGVAVKGRAIPAQVAGAIDKRTKLLALLESKTDEELEQLVGQVERAKARRKKTAE